MIANPITRPIARSVARAVTDTRRSAPVTRGPEIAPSLTDGGWAGGLAGAGGVSSDGTGLHFVNTASGTTSRAITTEDNVTYEIIYTIANFTGGSFRWQVYGATNAHLAQTTTRNANGTYTEQVTTSAAGSLNNLIRGNAVSGSGNSFDITALSIKKVLA
jgi:hypothetical protein